jgi:hypothetical protein
MDYMVLHNSIILRIEGSDVAKYNIGCSNAGVVDLLSARGDVQGSHHIQCMTFSLQLSNLKLHKSLTIPEIHMRQQNQSGDQPCVPILMQFVCSLSCSSVPFPDPTNATFCHDVMSASLVRGGKPGRNKIACTCVTYCP